MNAQQQAHFQHLYNTHLNHLTLQGKRRATIDAYALAMRRITAGLYQHLSTKPFNSH